MDGNQDATRDDIHDLLVEIENTLKNISPTLYRKWINYHIIVLYPLYFNNLPAYYKYLKRYKDELDRGHLDKIFLRDKNVV